MTKYTTKPLHPITRDPQDNRRNLWCGPAALSTITGRNADQFTRSIKDYRYGHTGRLEAIKGTHSWELEAMLQKCRYRMDLFEDLSLTQPTLARWLRERSSDARNHTYLIEVTRHWVVVRANKICDTATKAPVNTGSYPRRRKRVRKVWRVCENQST